MKVFALLATRTYALQGLFATRLGAEQAQSKLDFPTIIAECDLGP